MPEVPDGMRLVSQWTVLPDDPLALRTWLRARAVEHGEAEQANADEERLQQAAADEHKTRKKTDGAGGRKR